MPIAELLSGPNDVSFSFHLPPEREAREPAEVRGSGRDDVRLLVTHRGGMEHARFGQLPDFLVPGDLVVLNASATIPAALVARRADGAGLLLHISTRLPADLYVIEPRDAVVPHERLRLAGGGRVDLLTPYRDSRRLWIARLYLPTTFIEFVFRYGQPIRYRHSSKHWPLAAYQNVYATEPGSAEMPSAGRPFTSGLLEALRRRGIGVASIILHAGVGSLELDEAPHDEYYNVPANAAAAIRRARRNGYRVIAVGTTVVRALESALDSNGDVVASRGWADLVVTPERGVRAVDGLLTGFHEPNSSHLAMLAAICGKHRLLEAYRAALDGGYLWHEFGDSHLVLLSGPRPEATSAGE